MPLKRLTAAAVLILVPATGRAQQPSAQYPTIAISPQASQIVYAPTGCAFPGFTFAPSSWFAETRPTRQYALGGGPVGSCLGNLGQKISDGLRTKHVWTVTHTRYRVVRQPRQAVYYTVAPCPTATATPQYQAPPAPPVPAAAPAPPKAAVAEAAPPPPAVPDLEPSQTLGLLPGGQ